MASARWITLQELEDHGAQWSGLAADSQFPSAFADPAWILPWWRSYGEGHEPWTLALEDRDGGLRGLALLALRRSTLARTLGFAGGSWNGLEALLAAPGAEEELTAALLAALAERRREWDAWRVARMPAASVLAQTLLGGRAELRAAAHDARLQPFITLPDDVEGFEARFGAKQRGTLRRKWRRLRELGAEAHLVSDPDAVEPALDALLELRRARAVAMGQRYRHMDARFQRFLLETVRGLLPDRARLWALRLDGRTLASHLDFVQGPREHSYLLGFSDDHANLSPGTALAHHAIHRAIEEGRRELDLGPGRDDYKYRLTATDRELTRLVVSSGSPRGRGVTRLLGTDLRLRNTALADLLRQRRGLTPERGNAAPVGEQAAPAGVPASAHGSDH